MFRKFLIYLSKSDAVNIFKIIDVAVVNCCYMLKIYSAMLYTIGIELRRGYLRYVFHVELTEITIFEINKHIVLPHHRQGHECHDQCKDASNKCVFHRFVIL